MKFWDSNPNIRYQPQFREVALEISRGVGSRVNPVNPSRQVAQGKFRFALSLFSLFHILAIIGSAKDVYLEKFGADATAIGCLFSVARTSKHFFVRSKRVRNQEFLGKRQAFLLGIGILNHIELNHRNKQFDTTPKQFGHIWTIKP
jgi:hypothetical protein